MERATLSAWPPDGRSEMKYVLFVCTQNAGRSQIAQALFERHGPDDVRAESAGAEPADRVHPVVVEAMREGGVDLSGRRPKRLTLEMQLHADWAVEDPAGKPIEEVRVIRDEIEERVKELAQDRIGAIREDRRQHQMRM